MTTRCLAITIFALTLAAPASADPHAEAVALFDQGQKDMKAGNYAKACEELATSHSKWPDSGTKGSLALCETARGRVATAWQLWRELADSAPTPALRADATKRARKLEPRVPHFVVRLAKPTPGLVVTVNGKAIDLSVKLPLPTDPGDLAISVQAPGYTSWSQQLTASEGQSVTIDVPVLTPVAPATADASRGAPPTVSDDTGRRRHRRHLIGLAIGGAGAAALVVGGVFGLRANSAWDEAKTTCGGTISSCPVDRLQTAQSQVDDARSAANASTAFVVGGSIALAAGVVIWATAPKAERDRITLLPQVDPRGHVALALAGSF